jgi:carboxypeptidase Q
MRGSGTVRGVLNWPRPVTIPLLRALLALCAALGCAAAHPAPGAASARGASLEDVAARLVGEALLSRGAYDLVADLCDSAGPRLSGSPGAERGVEWAVARLTTLGFRPRTEKIMVPHWVRGEETGEIVSPAPQKIFLTALGGSDPTPPGGLEAEVVEAKDLDHLKTLGDRVRGRIVLFNKQIAAAEGMEGYGAGARIRHEGAVAAAKLGAVGMLLRSLGTAFLRTPHTGSMGYEEGAPRIPAAAVAAEDADMLHRMLARGSTVRVRMMLSCKTLPDVESANVLCDWPGRDQPQKIVLIGAHLDSWDLGVGAIDDGAGVGMVLEALRLMKKLGLRPRRTVRAVLYMNEENGLRGGRGYADAHKHEMATHVAAIEADSGAGRPLGFSVKGGPGADEVVRRLAAMLGGIGATEVTAGGEGGADISVLGPLGVPLLGLKQDVRHYFDWHHTPADTVDKIDPGELALGAAAVATMAYALADLPEALPRMPPEAKPK